MKLTLAITSLLTLILVVFAAVQENWFTEWRRLQREYRTILLTKARDEKERDLARRFSVEPRQIVVPDINTVDRCVSCHVGLDDPRMADQPQPFTSHPEAFLETHEVDRFGCTACHGGQGRATTKKEAHADEEEVFWERPLLPPPLNQNLCGTCHDPSHLKNRGAPFLARGLELFRENGCLGCHKLGERGGTGCPPLEGAGDKGKHLFPFAQVEGEKTVANWHIEHLKDPQRLVPGSRMPKVRLGDQEITALTTYLLSLRRVNLTERVTPRDRHEERYRRWHPTMLTGQELYRQFCSACHGEGVETIVHETLGRMIPAIRNPDFLAVVSEDFLFKNIHNGRPGTEMPAWGQPGGGLTDEEIRGIAAYLLEGGKEKRSVSFIPSAPLDPARGKNLFEAKCSACHASVPGDGNAPWLGSPGFQETYSDSLIGDAIKYGRKGTLMNPFGKEAGGDLDDGEISDLVGFIRTLK